MRKTYVLDTSTIVSDPYCLDSFPDANIVIHTKVLSELDKLKTSHGEVGRNARVFIRMLDELSERGSVSSGLEMGNKSTLKIDSKDYGTEFGTTDYTDNSLLACAKSMINGKNNPVAIVSQDINLRLRAKSAEIIAINHGGNTSTIDEIYSGIRTVVDERSGEMLKEEYQINCYENRELEDLLPNECVIFVNPEGKTIAYGRRRGDKVKFVNGTRAWGIGARNVEQAMALDLLMDPSVHLVSLAGIAGTGKTLLSMAAGIESVASLKIYDKMEIYRPFQPVGKDVGYLPGDLGEKLDPWMGAIKDSLEALAPNNRASDTHRRRNGSGGSSWHNSTAQFSDQIHMEALTYLRGRSIANTFILIDETQNITKDEIKTILTRAGENSKIILTGDIEQIDDSRLDAMNNGLTYAIDKFKSSELAGHISLREGVRSPLAAEAARLL
jgi:PhoH-like ATPase